jgi:hypothetical protein
MRENSMAPILDCLVSYFGLDEEQKPELRRYFCYHIIGGPGPEEESGVATLTTLAVYDESERCTYCRTFHAVETGGPVAAIAKVIRYLDDIHRGMHVRKIESEIRSLGEMRMPLSYGSHFTHLARNQPSAVADH